MVSGRGLCDGPIPSPEESYRLWCVIVCDLGTSSMRRPWAVLGCCAGNKFCMGVGRDSSVGVATRYGLHGAGSKADPCSRAA